MKVLFDMQAVQGHARSRGLGRYSLELAASMAALPDVTPVFILNDGLGAASLLSARRLIGTRIPSARIEVFDAPWPWLTNARDPGRHVEAEWVRDQFIRDLAPDAVIVCSLFSSPFESVVSVPESGRPFTAAVLYDLLPLTDPDSALAANDEAWYHHRLESLRRSDLLLSISPHSAQVAIDVLGADCPPLATIWGAAFSLPWVDSGERKGVVVAGGDGRRKNEASSVRAFAELPEEMRRAHPLTVMGRQAHPDLDPLAVARACGLGDDEVIVIGGEISDAELAELYARARLVVMPSRGEGLGLPVLESWRYGTPVITSNVTSLPELVGESRWTFAPDDVSAQSRLIRDLLSSDRSWQEAAEYGSTRAHMFT
ncbi:MAG: glycosyltransferase family 4 protein, partial [Caldilineaceae bacterium]